MMNLKVTKNDALALLGATVGGILGYVAFRWAFTQGFYALILPGGMIGIGASLFKSRSLPVSSLCGVGGLLLGLFSEWSYCPFLHDDSFSYFLLNSYKLKPITLILIALGTALAFFIPFRRENDH